MPSPFPGMDPFLEDESLWPIFHQQMVFSLYQFLLPSLANRYNARTTQRCYVAQQVLFTSIQHEEKQEQFIEIRQRSDNRLITILELVGLDNRRTKPGRQAYLEKKREARSAGASIVEIDLLMRGSPMFDLPQENLPSWDQVVVVTRSTAPDRRELYTATLENRLPRFKIPLAADDRDTVLDLQTVFTACYDQGRFGQRIDYRDDPKLPLPEGHLSKIDGWLKHHKLR